CTKTRFDYW
nr:immunoglobulin heavy chain junction region [Macaca mulatta]MOX15028.1 immunoglobulin heavy chain junction region [Macaca mulatta]MOX15084.1 immunoglobulin heavy chain junction region [Macaca mulatta]MOX15962.1 immunoglobulin heavy chain junction region [Macaca mulatta]MOX16475.1 immunoglobulin heavy chain junction region [Macaca mulatta]